MKVPFIDLKGEAAQIKSDYLAVVGSIIDEGRFMLGEHVEQFERAFAQRVGMKHCVGVSSGADALYLALRTLEIGDGDEVIVQGNAYNASITSILRVGAVPVFVDVDLDSARLDVHLIEEVITSKTKAIMPVHLYGQSNNMSAISLIAKQHGLKIIEDCAQAHDALWDGQHVGTFSDIAAFSFYPTKNLGAFGDAGAVVTNQTAHAQKLKALRNLGQVSKNDHAYQAYNMRLDVVQAACLNLKLNHLSSYTRSRRHAAQMYHHTLSGVRPLRVDPRAKHVYHLYVVACENRDVILKMLAAADIGHAIHYPTPVYDQPFFKGVRPHCPNTDALCKSILSLPLFSNITADQQQAVAAALV